MSTYAGSGGGGYLDGVTVNPKYNNPAGVAIAPSGNIYIADTGNNAIRRISDGVVVTFAGTGVAGYVNGAPNVAQFTSPNAIAVDASENVYITEANSNAIRKITSAGVVSTFAGSIATAGFTDASGTSARFNTPKGIATDSSGNIYVADKGNSRIRKITSAGVATTVAGTGIAGYYDSTALNAQFDNPFGVAVSSAGVIYVGDTSNNKIRAISTSGVVSTLAGSTPGFINGQGTSAQFNSPHGITIDSSGNLFVIDYTNNVIRKVTSAGAVTTFAGTGTLGGINGAGATANFKYPDGIAIDSSNNLLIGDTLGNTIRKITNAAVVSIYSGSASSGFINGKDGPIALFNSPIAVTTASNGITYVIDDFSPCIRKISADGLTVTTFAGDGNSANTGYIDDQGTAARFNSPKGMVLDSSGNIYVADTYNNRIRKVTSTGVVTTVAGDGTYGYLDGQGTAAKFAYPWGIAIDSSNNLYIADKGNSRIRKISASGAVTTVAGYILSGYADGAASVARFKNPQAIAVDSSNGTVYVADTANNRIRKITSDGTVSTLAGSTAGNLDGQGTAAQFYSPAGIIIDSSGNLIVSDYFNNVIKKVSSSGLVTTYAGSGYSDGVDSTLAASSFYFPVGMSMDSAGNIYIADSYTQRIRKITP